MAIKTAFALYWLLPAYLLFQAVYQIQVLRGLEYTYANGQSYTADVVDFRIKNMQAQSNGVIELRFTTSSGVTVDRRMTLPIQLAAQTQQYGKLPVRYHENSAQQIVIVPTYDFHHNMVRMNVAILCSSFVFSLGLGWFVVRWLRRQKKAEPLVFERTDLNQPPIHVP